MQDIIDKIFEDLEKYENRYGLSIPIGAYLKLKKKWKEYGLDVFN